VETQTETDLPECDGALLSSHRFTIRQVPSADPLSTSFTGPTI
jgi:hypothetical protein